MFGRHSSRRVLRAILLGASGYLALSVTPFLALGPDVCSAESDCVFSPGDHCLDGGRIISDYRPKLTIIESD